MKIISFQGGLGNQLFQYAFYKRMQKEFPDHEIYAEIFSYEQNKQHNGFELDSVFNLNLKYCNYNQYEQLASTSNTLLAKIKRKLFGHKQSEIIESELQKFAYSPDLFKSSEDQYFSGYWQSHFYIEEIREELLEELELKSELDPENFATISEMNESNSVGVHIRRGDYINHPNFGGICDIEYYSKAIELIQSKIENPSFYIFSDDIKWCASNLNLPLAKYVNWNTKSNSYLDLILMSKCKNNIIANSSFSWWGAYLNNNENKIVIAPSQWKNNMEGTRDLFPESWIVVK